MYLIFEIISIRSSSFSAILLSMQLSDPADSRRRLPIFLDRIIASLCSLHYPYVHRRCILGAQQSRWNKDELPWIFHPYPLINYYFILLFEIELFFLLKIRIIVKLFKLLKQISKIYYSMRDKNILSTKNKKPITLWILFLKTNSRYDQFHQFNMKKKMEENKFLHAFKIPFLLCSWEFLLFSTPISYIMKKEKFFRYFKISQEIGKIIIKKKTPKHVK